MQFRIEILKEKKLIGMHKRMSFANSSTPHLWQTFIPRRNEVKSITTDLFSLEVFDNTSFFQNFDPKKEFEKWAAVD